MSRAYREKRACNIQTSKFLLLLLCVCGCEITRSPSDMVPEGQVCENTDRGRIITSRATSNVCTVPISSSLSQLTRGRDSDFGDTGGGCKSLVT